jgi:hypothetical protein
MTSLSDATLVSTGVILLTVVFVAYGGTFLLRVVNGAVPANELQRAYFRAGHAHAGVLIVLGLVIRLWMHASGVPGWSAQVADAVLYAAILMPAGFFLSVIGRDPQRPNRLAAFIWLGAASLSIGLIGAATGLIIAGTG